MEILQVKTSELVPYERNAKEHPEKQIEHIANSIEAFGFRSPIVAWKDGTIINGHGRLLAALKLGIEEVPVIYADDLTEEEANAFRLADNKTAESSWDELLLADELADLFDFDMGRFGFDQWDGWFSSGDKGEAREGEDEYAEFLEKFEEKHTTDDCYTPANIYDVVAEWVENEYGVKRKNFVRPFYPGGDYHNEKYKDTDIVVDNPPFSIFAEIVRFYMENGIKFFLFAPSLTILHYTECTAVCVGAGITYENGACVLTSYLTNLETGTQARTAPDLYDAITSADKENRAKDAKNVNKIEYPAHVATAAMLSKLSKYGQEFKIMTGDCASIKKLDAQTDTTIYGEGLLLSEKAAAEKAAAERYELSPREWEIVKSLG